MSGVRLKPSGRFSSNAGIIEVLHLDSPLHEENKRKDYTINANGNSELQQNLEKLTPEEKFRSEVERVKVHDIKKIKKGQYNRWKSQFRITKKFRKVNTRRKVSFRGRTRESFRFDLQLQEVNKNYRASREKGDS